MRRASQRRHSHTLREAERPKDIPAEFLMAVSQSLANGDANGRPGHISDGQLVTTAVSGVGCLNFLDLMDLCYGIAGAFVT